MSYTQHAGNVNLNIVKELSEEFFDIESCVLSELSGTRFRERQMPGP